MQMQDFTGGEGDDLMSSDKCMIYDPTSGASENSGISHWEVRQPCPQAKGICKQRLGMILAKRVGCKREKYLHCFLLTSLSH